MNFCVSYITLLHSLIIKSKKNSLKWETGPGLYVLSELMFSGDSYNKATWAEDKHEQNEWQTSTITGIRKCSLSRMIMETKYGNDLLRKMQHSRGKR